MPRRPLTTLAMAPRLPRQLFAPDVLARLRAAADVDPDHVLSDYGALGDAEVLLTSWGAPPVDAAALANAPRLKAIVHAAGSVKRIVGADCWRRGIVVSSAAGANAVPVAEYTLAMVLLAGKRVLTAAHDYHRRGGRPPIREPTGNYGRTVGIVGASRVGRRVVELLRPFDLEVVVSDPLLDDPDSLGVRRVELDELCAASDVVSLHAPAVPATRHMIGRRQLGLMRDGATLINTARGALVDHAALLAELAVGRISAVLDVTEPEPLPVDSPFFDLPNVLVTPHVAGAQGLEVQRLGASAVAELERYARGLPFEHPVTPAQLEHIA